MRIRPITLLFGGVALCFAFLLSIPRLASHPSKAAANNSSTSDYTVRLVPDQLTLAGKVATQANTKGHCTEAWLTDVPTGTIILGVDPTSCDPADWTGGSATAQVSLPNVYTRTVIVLKLSWPDRDGKGLHSPEPNRKGVIAFDGRRLWDKRTTKQSTFDHFYAAEHNPILTTIVVTQSITHTLTFSVPARTAWDLSEIELIAYPYSATIRGIGYSPYRDCQSPDTSSQPTTENITEDLLRLFHTSNAIRTYAATGVNNQIPALANAVGLPVFAGAWIDNTEQDDDEIQALIDLANTTQLEGAIVGNEFYLRHRTVTDTVYLHQRILEVKSGINDKDLPVTTAEIDNLMFIWESNSATVPEGINPNYQSILDEVDFVLVHIYPFWSGLSIDGAAAFTVNRYKGIQALIEQAYPGQNKRVIIGETGWPSAGAPNGSAVPSMENQRRYMLEFICLAEQEGVEYMYFDAFDELWKIEERGRVGPHWGYSYTDRTAKHNFYGVLLPAEQLPCSEPSSSYRAYLPYLSYIAGGDSNRTLPVYTEWLAEPSLFVPSGLMGDIENFSMFECDRTDPHGGEMAVRVSFSPTGTLGWGGVYWQHPENNWGNLKGGHVLTGASHLTFWVRGEQGGEVVEFLVGGVGEHTDPYSDSIQPARSTGDIVLSDTWQQVEISLAGEDLSRVIGGFAWTASSCYVSEPITFYLDDIVFDFDPAPKPLPAPTRKPFHVYQDNDSTCNHFVPSGWMGDIGHIDFDQGYALDPRSGTSAIRISYDGNSWAGVYWVEPEGNWGDSLGGYDLVGADRLTFWARSDTPNARIKFLIGGIGYPNGTLCWIPSEPYPDSVCPKIEQRETLSAAWSQHTIDLHQYPRNLRGVVGGFGWVVENPTTFYLDDIVYEFD